MNLTTEFDEQLALAYVSEEAEGESATQEQKLEAWAFLIKTAKVWSMKRHMRAEAVNLMEMGLIEEDGTINWEVHDELQQ
jgi:hypothetical protein